MSQQPLKDQMHSPRRSRRIWKWFTFGFLMGFVGMLLFYPMLFYNGNGANCR